MGEEGRDPAEECVGEEGRDPAEECVGEEGRDPAEECVGECAVVNEVHNVNANFDAEAHVWSLPVEGGTQ